jgi:hypothetical protein
MHDSYIQLLPFCDYYLREIMNIRDKPKSFYV